MIQAAESDQKLENGETGMVLLFGQLVANGNCVCFSCCFVSVWLEPNETGMDVGKAGIGF